MSSPLLRFLLFVALLGGAIATMAIDAVDPPSCNPVPTQCTEGTPCDDWDACTTGEMCVAGECVGGQAVVCDDGDLCTDDMCDAIQGCYWEPAYCDDGFECSVDGCDSLAGCVHDYTPCNPALELPTTMSVAEFPAPWPSAPVDACATGEFTLEGFAAVAPTSTTRGPVDLYLADVAGGPALYLASVIPGVLTFLVCAQPIVPWDPQAPRQLWVADPAQYGINPHMEWHHYACAGSPGGDVFMWIDGMPVAPMPDVQALQDPGRPAVWMGHQDATGAPTATEVPGWLDGIRLSGAWLYAPMAPFPMPPERWLGPDSATCLLWNFSYAPGTTEMPDEMMGLRLLGLDAAVEIPGAPPLPYMPLM